MKMVKKHLERITKREFYALGAFTNPKLMRKGNTSGKWKYYKILD